MQLHPFELFSLVELVEPGLFRDYRDYDNQRSQLPVLNNLMRELKQWAILDEEQRAQVLRRERTSPDVGRRRSHGGRADSMTQRKSRWSWTV